MKKSWAIRPEYRGISVQLNLVAVQEEFWHSHFLEQTNPFFLFLKMKMEPEVQIITKSPCEQTLRINCSERSPHGNKPLEVTVPKTMGTSWDFQILTFVLYLRYCSHHQINSNVLLSKYSSRLLVVIGATFNL